ncbi:MAG: hypothetical protein HRU51_09955 [Xanthomonadales bacterium]|nr:hypothetical protein [Xanthomonadales bacterium]
MPKATVCRITPSARWRLLLLTSLLSLPLLVSFWTDHGARAHFERRALAQPPELALGTPHQAFISATERYVNDHMGFSLALNSLYRKAQFYLFQDSPVANISVGENRFPFLNSHSADHPFQRLKTICEPVDNITRAKQTLADLHEALAARNVRLQVAMVPSKLALYPDRIPGSVPTTLAESCRRTIPTDMMAERLKAPLRAAGVHYIFPRAKLYDQRNETAFYPTENFHAEGWSGHLFAQETLLAMGIDPGESYSAEAELITKDHDLNMLGFRREIRVWYFPYRKYDLTIKQRQPAWLRAWFPSQRNYRMVTTIVPASERRALLLSNSFGDYVYRDLAPGFRSLVHMNINNVSTDEIRQFGSSMLTQADATDLILLAHDGNLPLEKIASLIWSLKEQEQSPPR